jgi:hypothetical protein
LYERRHCCGCKSNTSFVLLKHYRNVIFKVFIKMLKM